MQKTKNFFGGLGGSMKSSLKPLVMMQLKDKIDFSFLKNKKKTFFKIIWTILGFALVTALIYLLFMLVVKFGLFSFIQMLNFRVFLVVMTVMLILAFISCLLNVTNTLYFAKDNPVLLTMPVKNSTIFTSKMIVCFIYELLKNATYILPTMIAYGMVMGLPLTYYLWAIFSFVFLTLLMVLICGLLSIPAMAIGIAFKKHRTFEFITLAIVAGAVIFAVIEAILHIPTDIDLVRDWGQIYWDIQDYLANFATSFVAFDYLLQFLTGMVYNGFVFTPFSLKNFAIFGVCVGIMLVCFLVIYFLSKPLFLKMASTPFEYKKRNIKRIKRNHKKRAFVSSANQQSRQIFRSANLIYSVIAVAFATPIAILLQNQIISAMDTRITGEHMGIAFNVLIIMLLMLSSNTTIASMFSREGNAGYLNKTNPVPYRTILTGKMVLNACICMLSIIVSTGVINYYANIGVINSLFLCFGMLFVYLAHLFWSAELDVMNPQNRLYQTSGKQQKNPNESKSTLIAFISSGLFAFISYFLLGDPASAGSVFFKLFVIGAVYFGIRLYLLLTKIRLYYKEK